MPTIKTKREGSSYMFGFFIFYLFSEQFIYNFSNCFSTFRTLLSVIYMSAWEIPNHYWICLKNTDLAFYLFVKSNHTSIQNMTLVYSLVATALIKCGWLRTFFVWRHLYTKLISQQIQKTPVCNINHHFKYIFVLLLTHTTRKYVDVVIVTWIELHERTCN